MNTFNRLLWFILLGCLGLPLQAQKVMLLETTGQIESRRFYIGDEMDIKLKNDDHGWYKTILTDMNIDRELVFFDFGMVRLDEIAVLRTEKQKTLPRSIRNKLLMGGLSFILLSPLNLAIGEDYPVWALYVGGSMIAAGFLQEFVLDKTLKHRMGKRKRLRLVDLTFSRGGTPDNSP